MKELHDLENETAQHGPVQDQAAVNHLRESMLQEVMARESDLRDAAAIIIERLEGYQTLDDHGRHDVIDTIQHVQHVFLACLQDHRQLSPDERADLEDLGRQRADQGIPHESIDDAFGAFLQAGLSMLDAYAQTVVAEGDAFATLASLTAELIHLVRGAGAAITRGYHRGLARQESSRTRWVAAVLDGRSADADGLAGTTVANLLIVRPLLAGRDGGPRAALADLEQLVVGLVPGPVRHDPVIHAVALVPDVDLDEFVQVCDSAAARHRVAIVHARVATATEAGERYRLVREHLAVTSAASSGSAGIVPMRDFLATAMVGSALRPLTAAYVREVLGRVLAAPGSTTARVLDTIDAYRRSGPSHRKVGEALGVHRQTAANRIGQVEHLTGLSLEDSDGALRILLARDLLRIFPELVH